MFSRRVFALLFIAALAACSRTSSQQAGPNMWVPDNGQAKIYFYVAYDTPNDEPFFPETFRFRLDNGYLGEFGKDKYVETSVIPGDYMVSVDEIDWGGNVPPHPLKLRKQFHAGQSVFVAAYIKGKNVSLVERGKAQGLQDIGIRKRTGSSEELTSITSAIF